MRPFLFWTGLLLSVGTSAPVQSGGASTRPAGIVNLLIETDKGEIRVALDSARVAVIQASADAT